MFENCHGFDSEKHSCHFFDSDVGELDEGREVCEEEDPRHYGLIRASIVTLVAANCDALVATFSLRRSLSTQRVRDVSFSFFVIQLPVGKMGWE